MVIPKGSPENPMSLDEILEKQNGTNAFAACPVKEGAIERLVKLVRGLENCENVNELLGELHEAFLAS